ncbi:hypothetical protein CY35_11G058100 [Sphagnum magellanicum]|nr:hypothetical protein CY35_11G058100 [Sphagnum magellanicum]
MEQTGAQHSSLCLLPAVVAMAVTLTHTHTEHWDHCTPPHHHHMCPSVRWSWVSVCRSAKGAQDIECRPCEFQIPQQIFHSAPI